MNQFELTIDDDDQHQDFTKNFQSKTLYNFSPIDQNMIEVIYLNFSSEIQGSLTAPLYSPKKEEKSLFREEKKQQKEIKRTESQAQTMNVWEMSLNILTKPCCSQMNIKSQ